MPLMIQILYLEAHRMGQIMKDCIISITTHMCL
uniref:Uncharacterized protein n=1 Tax=Rhizophora mucronata TaxID=61149 RepID=A0A2P2NDN7_RHIMU